MAFPVTARGQRGARAKGKDGKMAAKLGAKNVVSAASARGINNIDALGIKACFTERGAHEIRQDFVLTKIRHSRKELENETS